MKTKIVWAIPAVLLAATNPKIGQHNEHDTEKSGNDAGNERDPAHNQKPTDPLWDDYNFLFSLSLS